MDGEEREADWAEISPAVYSMLIGDRSYELHLEAHPTVAPLRDTSYTVTVGPHRFQLEIQDPRSRRRVGAPQSPEGPQELVAPMPGKIVKVLVTEGQEVAQGEGLLVVEAMKMQNEIRAPRAGRVERIYVGEGNGVETGAKLVRLN